MDKPPQKPPLALVTGEIESYATPLRPLGHHGQRLWSLVQSEYGISDVGAGIGWHRDKKHFDQVFGLSLASACKFRFRRKIGNSWERFMLNTEPRSLYVMTGASRHGANCLDAGWSRFCQDLGDGPPAQVRHRRSMDRVERWPSPSSGPHRLMRAQLRVPLRLRPRLRA